MVDRELDDKLVQFKDEYLKSRRDVHTYRKLKKYSRYGLYLSGLLLYAVVAMYFSSDFAVTDSGFIIVSVIATVSVALTILFRLNRRSYDFDKYDLVYHEVAALIEAVEENSPEEEIEQEIEKFRSLVIHESENILPRKWREEADSYLDYVEHEGEDEFYQTMPEIFNPLVDMLNELSQLNLEESYRNEDTQTKTVEQHEPGFIGVIVDSINSDVISKEMVIWSVFALAVFGGLILAFIQGQGWGVLLVTIVFGGLRLYDRQKD